MRKSKIAKIVLVFLLSCALVGIVAGCGPKAANNATPSTSKSNFVIGFSNSYNGNSFRQTLEENFTQAANQLKQQGAIADYSITESNNNNEEQASQIEDMVLKHVSCIIIDPGSPTALNGAIAKAQAANIPVFVVNDGPVTSTSPYELLDNNLSVTDKGTDWMINQLHGQGNVLLCRGIPGNQYDLTCYNEMMKIIKQHPGIKVVGQYYGQWTDSIAQSACAAILPSMPKIDGIEGEGGDTYGTMQAFQAAGRPFPVMSGGNRGIMLHWWRDQLAKSPNFTDYSVCVDPSVAAASLYEAVDLLNGKTIPQNVVFPSLEITNATLSQYANLPDARVASRNVTADWVTSNLENQQSASIASWLNGQ